jgi:hypothetical protein
VRLGQSSSPDPLLTVVGVRFAVSEQAVFKRHGPLQRKLGSRNTH